VSVDSARSVTSAAWKTVIYEGLLPPHMSVVDSHEDGAGDDEEDPEESVRVLEGHAVQFNEYRY